MPSQFDPSLYLDAQVDTPNVKRPPLPKENPATNDHYYIGVIGEIKMSSGTISKGEKMGQPWLAASVPITIEVPQQVQDALNLKLDKGTIVLTDFVMIDLTPHGTIDNSVGRNRRQRQYREALDLNKPGDVWSWRKASGQVIKVGIDHEMYNGEVQDKIGAVLRRG
jgi:hypothetical protein